MNTLLKLVLSDIVIIAICFLASPYYYYYSPTYKPIIQAIARLYPTKGNSAMGTITFTQEAEGVRIVAECSNLTPGKHGIHIHEFGNCSCDDAECTGAHYNPTKQPHAARTDVKRHMGDLGNVEVNEQGIGRLEYVDHEIKLNGPHAIIGRAVIIHEKEDDLITQPSGNAGSRLSCGVIGVKK